MRKVIINGKFLTQKITGVQRFACEISRHLPYSVIHPPAERLTCEIPNEKIKIGPIAGNLWEQVLVLPEIRNSLLLSLGNTAPLMHPLNLITIHDLAWKYYPDSFSRTFVLYYSFLIPRLVERALHIFTVSQFSREQISREFRVPMEKITVIYNGVSGRFRPLNTEKENIILSVATLQPYKNLKNLIKAFMLSKDRGWIPSEYRLMLVGGVNRKVFSSTGGVFEAAARREDIVFTGYLQDRELVLAYNRARIFALVSLYEGFGLPALEAMACGTPALLSNRASLPEVGGDAALYVDPENVEDIASGLSRLIEDTDLWSELREKGLRRASRFTWEESASKMRRVIEEML